MSKIVLATKNGYWRLIIYLKKGISVLENETSGYESEMHKNVFIYPI